MQRVKAHTLRQLEEAKLVEELTKFRVSTYNLLAAAEFRREPDFSVIFDIS